MNKIQMVIDFLFDQFILPWLPEGKENEHELFRTVAGAVLELAAETEVVSCNDAHPVFGVHHPDGHRRERPRLEELVALLKEHDGEVGGNS